MTRFDTNQNERNNNSQKGGLLRGLFNAGVLISLAVVALLVRGYNFFDSKATITNTSDIAHNTDEFIGKIVENRR